MGNETLLLPAPSSPVRPSVHPTSRPVQRCPSVDSSPETEEGYLCRRHTNDSTWEEGSQRSQTSRGTRHQDSGDTCGVFTKLVSRRQSTPLFLESKGLLPNERFDLYGLRVMSGPFKVLLNVSLRVQWVVYHPDLWGPRN